MGFDTAYEALTEERRRPALGVRHRLHRPAATASTPRVPAGVDGADLAAYCLMLGDDALVMSHRLQQWLTRAPELEEEIALANIALDLLGQARLLLTQGRRGRRHAAATEDDYAFGRDRARVPQRPAGRGRRRRLRRPDRPAAGASAPGGWRCSTGCGHRADPVLAAVAAQGRQGADLPPRLRGAVGDPARRRHRLLARADAGRPRRRRAARWPSCSTPSEPSGWLGRRRRRPGRAASRVRRGARPGAGRGRAGPGPRPPALAGAPGRPAATACTPRRWAPCWPSCRAWPARTRGRHGDAAPAAARAARQIAAAGARPRAADADPRRPRHPARRHRSTATGVVVVADADLLRLPGDARDARTTSPAGWPRPGSPSVEVRTVLEPAVDHRLDHRRTAAASWPRPASRRPVPRPRRTAGPVPLTLAPAPRRGRPARAADRPTPSRPPRSAPPPARRCTAAGPAASRSSTSRRSDDAATAAAAGTARPRRRRQFHALTVAGVDRLCDDAVAVDLRRAARAGRASIAFRPGQSLTLRRVVDGRDERRSYSICAPAGAAAADRRARGARRRVVRLAGARGAARRPDRGAAADRVVHPRPRHARPATC